MSEVKFFIPVVTGEGISFTELPQSSEVIAYFEANGITEGNYVLANTDGHETSKTWKSTLSKFWGYITKGRKAEINLAKAQKELESLRAEMLDSATTPERMKEVAELYLRAQKVIDNGGKTGSKRSGNGDRANLLPPIEESKAIARNGDSANGRSLVAFRGDAVPADWHMSKGDWQCFEWVGKGETRKLQYIRNVGNHTSWSALNQFLHNEVLGKDGKSIGLSGLKPVTNEQAQEMLKNHTIKPAKKA